MLRVRRIATKVAVAVAIAVSIGVALLAFSLQQTARRHVYEESARDALHLVDALWLSVQSAMRDGRHEHLRGTFDSLAHTPGVKRIQLLDHAGRVRYSTRRSDEGSSRSTTSPECRTCHVGGRPPTSAAPWSYEIDDHTLGIARPVYALPSCQRAECHSSDESKAVLGVVLMSLSTEHREASVSDLSRHFILFGAAFAVLVSIIVFVLLTHLVGRPVGRLVEETRRMVGGELDRPIAVRTDDEIGELARSFNDSTQRLSQAQQRLNEIERLASVGRLASGVAHEINNPLTGILTYAETLREDLQDEQQRADIDAVIGETLRCREIVHRLLDFARTRRSTKRRGNLNELTAHATDLLARQKAFENVAIVRRLAPDLPDVMLDTNQFHQVIVNLVVNAAESMPRGGEVVIATELSGDGTNVVLRVTDSGSGIPPEVRTHVFDPFFTTKPQGTGLGLPVVWGIVQQHQGKLSFVTEAGRGTTFAIELPVCLAP